MIIQLTKGYSTIVDDADYAELAAYNWYAQGPMKDGRVYAVRRVPSGVIYMHRHILGLQLGDPMHVDHREPGTTLDNRRSNLRIATQTQNLWNSRVHKHSTTRLKGAFPKHGRGNFFSRITVNKKIIHLGTFPMAEAAHAAYCVAAAKYHGEFARTN